MTQPSGDELTVLLCVPSPHEAEQSSQSNISHTQGQASVLHGLSVGGCAGVSDVISQSSGERSTVLFCIPPPQETEQVPQSDISQSPQEQASKLHDCSVGGFVEVGVQSEGDATTVLSCVPSPHVAEQSSQSDISQSQEHAPKLHDCSVDGCAEVGVQPAGDASTVLSCVPSPHVTEQSSQSDISQSQVAVSAKKSKFEEKKFQKNTRSDIKIQKYSSIQEFKYSSN